MRARSARDDLNKEIELQFLGLQIDVAKLQDNFRQFASHSVITTYPRRRKQGRSPVRKTDRQRIGRKVRG
jgi:hypothetical protein